MTSLLLSLLTALQMLSSFMHYVVNDYQPIDSLYGCFRGENTMGADERGVRTNADLSMVAAFMGRYAKEQVTLPQGITWEQLDTISLKSLRYAVATHKAVRKRACKDGRYWGSVSVKDHQWESSLWAMSVAYSAFFQWDRLPQSLKDDIHTLLKAECNYELQRTIPTGYIGDTKAEENGWEVDVLAATLGLFPTDSLAPQWFERMRAFAINSYSHPSDASNRMVIDPWYDNKTVADLYKGPNLYPDWTLQNHNFFHTSYQNVVIQELGEAALALRLFQGSNPRWHSNALLHNCDSVAKNVLNWLTLPDGEQAMPNGNDWSLYLYDQVTSYSTLACMLGDRDALMFEQQALQQIALRQRLTKDGSWLLHPDVGARRMGVEAHRVMMTWLMHHVFPTDGLKPSTWSDFAQRYAKAKWFPCQNIVRTLTKDYFACFSFSKGLKSFTGYMEPLKGYDLWEGNLIVPYRHYNTGNIIGWYETSKKDKDGKVVRMKPNARLLGEPKVRLYGNYFSAEAQLLENDSSLLRHFTLLSTPKGLLYNDTVKVLRHVTIDKDKTGMLAISNDPFAGLWRSEYYQKITGKDKASVKGLLNVEAKGGSMRVGDESIDNSINTLKLYPYGGKARRKHEIKYLAK